MTKTLILAFILFAGPGCDVFAGATSPEQWGAVTNNIQMGISAKDGETRIHTNQPMNLILRIKNLSLQQGSSRIGNCDQPILLPECHLLEATHNLCEFRGLL